MAPRTRSAAAKAAQHHHFEFFGPYIGPIALLVGLPALCYALVYACNPQGCLRLAPFSVPGFPPGQSFFSWEATAIFILWIVLQVVLHLILPGPRVKGVQLPDGSHLSYKLTGEGNFWVTLAGVFYFCFYQQSIDLSWAYHNYVPLMTAAIGFSYLLSVYLYLRSFAAGASLAAGGSTGVPLYDFFIGRELNPRIGSLDLKEFCELYPGLIGWLILDLAMAHHQWKVDGSISIALVLTCAFQGLYVWDALHHERAILTTMDITTDGFGFMLAFGDLAWVPFTYSLQARILADASPKLSLIAIFALLTLKLAGYAAFRGANSQKDLFR
jgi:Delta14-sterol reductase